VQPYGVITSPAEAAGERAPNRSLEAKSLAEAVEERLTMRKVEIWRMAFKAIIAYIVRYFGDIAKRLGDRIAGTLTIKILRKRLRLGKFLAKPFYWLAKLLFRLADKLERAALAMEPKQIRSETPVDQIPSSTLLDGVDEDTSLEDGDLTDPNDDDVNALPLEPMDTAYDASSGQFFLMHASNVLQAVEAAATRSEQHDLRYGLQLYQAAQELRSQVNNFQKGSHISGAGKTIIVLGELGRKIPGRNRFDNLATVLAQIVNKT
jgi:hypothetical protein